MVNHSLIGASQTMQSGGRAKHAVEAVAVAVALVEARDCITKHAHLLFLLVLIVSR